MHILILVLTEIRLFIPIVYKINIESKYWHDPCLFPIVKIAYPACFLFLILVNLYSLKHVNLFIMKRYRIVLCSIAFFFIAGVSSLYSQELKGNWKAYKKTDIDGGDGSDFTMDGEPYKADVVVTFLDGGKAAFVEAGVEYDVTYQMEGKVLKIGNREYGVKEATATELVLEETTMMGEALIYLKKS